MDPLEHGRVGGGAKKVSSGLQISGTVGSVVSSGKR